MQNQNTKTFAEGALKRTLDQLPEEQEHSFDKQIQLIREKGYDDIDLNHKWKSENQKNKIKSEFDKLLKNQILKTQIESIENQDNENRQSDTEKTQKSLKIQLRQNF